MATVATDTQNLWFLDSLAKIRVTRDGEDPVSIIEMTAPHGAVPPRHAHREAERIHVLEGEMTFYIGEEVVSMTAGASVEIPAGVPHMYVVQSKDGAKWLSLTGGCFEQFVRAVGRPAEGRGLPPTRGLSLAEAVEFTTAAARYGIELLGPARVTPAAA